MNIAAGGGISGYRESQGVRWRRAGNEESGETYRANTGKDTSNAQRHPNHKTKRPYGLKKVENSG